jgi:deoxyadenosine/deoxycytidine kinase
VYTVEGEIAAGKTELTKAIAEALQERGLSVCLVPEPVDSWRELGILQKFYADPGRHGYGFQTYVFATRVLGIAAAVAAYPHADVYLLERSPATDGIFMETLVGMIDPIETRMYRTWCAAYELILPIDLAKARVLYLKPTLARCMARLSRRGREGEVGAEAAGATVARDGSATGGVSLEYQERLRRAHEAFFQGRHPGEFPRLPASPFPRESVIEIGAELADGNFRDPSPERDRIVAAVLARMGCC